MEEHAVIMQLTQVGLVEQSDSGGYEIIAVLLFAAPWLDKSEAESALLHDGVFMERV